MTTCTHLSDLMPATALGRRRWTPEEAEHLECCTDCRAEWALVQAASGLDGELADLNWALVARAARARTRAVRPLAGGARRVALGLAAAAAAVVLFVRIAPRLGRVTPSTASTASTPSTTLTVVALDSLSEDELRLVLAAVSGPSFGADVELDPSGLEELDSTDLQQMLLTLEGS